METITIELKHPKALSLLKDLEAMAVIKLVTTSRKGVSGKLSEILRGSLDSKSADDLSLHIQNSRTECERGI